MANQSVAIIGTRGYPSYYGGFETAVRKLAPYLADHGWDVTVYGRAGSTKPDDPARDARVRSRLTRGLQTKSLSTLSYGLTAAVDSFRQRPDVALVMNVANGFFLPILKSRQIPTVVNVDGIEWERDKWSAIGKAVFHAGARWTARYADRIIYDAKEIGRRWDNEFGVSGDFIPYGGDVPDSLPVEPGLKSGQYVLVVARFVPENTLPEFIAAADTLAERFDVVFVGSAGYGGLLDEQVQALADRSPRVRWFGHIADDKRLLALWQHAGAYFHGHSVGGTNPALVQAMAAGAPIVARDTVYNREVLGETGVFTAPRPEAIVQTVATLLQSPENQSRYSRLAQQRAREHYSWDGVCAAYEASLLRVLELRR